MLIVDDKTQTCLAGPFDVILILKDVKTGLFHPCFAEEVPPPGPVQAPNTNVIRLKSKLVHTRGYVRLDEAKADYKALRAKITVNDLNASDDPMPWSGRPFVHFVQNWRLTERNVRTVLPQ